MTCKLYNNILYKLYENANYKSYHNLTVIFENVTTLLFG